MTVTQKSYHNTTVERPQAGKYEYTFRFYVRDSMDVEDVCQVFHRVRFHVHPEPMRLNHLRTLVFVLLCIKKSIV